MRLVGKKWEYEVRLLQPSRENLSTLLRKITKKSRWECHEIAGMFPDMIAILKRRRKAT